MVERTFVHLHSGAASDLASDLAAGSGSWAFVSALTFASRSSFPHQPASMNPAGTPPRTPVATFYLEKTLTAPHLAPILQIMAAGMVDSVAGTEASMEMFSYMRSLPNSDPRLVALEDLHITLAELRERIGRNLPPGTMTSLIERASSGEAGYGRVFDAIAEAAAVE